MNEDNYNNEQQNDFLKGVMNQGAYTSPMYQYAGTIVDLTDTEELLQRLEMNLSGTIIDERGLRKRTGEALLNDDGVKVILGIVRSAGNQAGIMSDFEKNEVGVLMEYLNDTLSRDLMLNKHKYQIPESKSVRSTIIFMANACCFAIIKRGFEGGERRFWRGSQQEITFKGGEPQKKGGGFLTGLFKK